MLQNSKSRLYENLKLASIPVFVASLCCLSPIILLLLGFVTVGVAADLADVFYGTYKWVFRFVGFLALCFAYYLYLKRRGICTFDEVKRQRNEIINKFLLLLITGILGYLFFLYVVVHYIGVWLSVWK